MPSVSWRNLPISPAISALTRLCARTDCHFGILLFECLQLSGVAMHSGRSHTSFIVMHSKTASPRAFRICISAEKKFCPPRTVLMQIRHAASICSSGQTTS